MDDSIGHSCIMKIRNIIGDDILFGFEWDGIYRFFGLNDFGKKQNHYEGSYIFLCGVSRHSAV